MSETMAGITTRLRESTKQLHDAVEGHAFQQAFAAGKLPLRAYVAYLEQMYAVYAPLESCLGAAQERCHDIAAVVQPANYRTNDLRDDLAHFGIDAGAVAPLPDTRAFVAFVAGLAEHDPRSLLGVHYVLEGSNNGNWYIARNVRRAYGLSGAGTRFLDPYGVEQRRRWQEYKTALEQVGLTDGQGDALVAAAMHTFRGITRISEALHAAMANELPA